MTTYFAAGGLLGSAWVNLVQLVVLLAGFAIAAAGGASHTRAASTPCCAAARTDGLRRVLERRARRSSFLVLLVPAFMSSPGLLQKAFGARERAGRPRSASAGTPSCCSCSRSCRRCSAWRRACTIRGCRRNWRCRRCSRSDLPAGFGSILLAAIFSAEVSTADAVLFMLATSLSQDLYRRFVRPDASDAQVLRVARWAAVAGGALGILARARDADDRRRAELLLRDDWRDGASSPVLVALHARVNRRVEVTASILAGAAAVLTAHSRSESHPAASGPRPQSAC